MTYDSILTALADPTRRGILEDLRAQPLPVARLAEARPVSRPAVSQHLKVLERAGLVEAKSEGASRIYSVKPKGLAPLKAYLDEFWGDALASFAAEVQRQLEEDNDRTSD